MIDEKDDYGLIKRYYGEKMAQFCCRYSHFSKILETEGLLYKLLDRYFAHSKFLYNDIMNNGAKYTFISFILKKYDLQISKQEEVKTQKTPYELLNKAGYILYECHSEKDIQSFRHFYDRKGKGACPEYVEGTEPEPCVGEELCTFNGGRLEECYVYFAVKKNVNEIKREYFKDIEERQDEYGTSVISIQISKTKPHTLSIKNRYNHTVNHPDGTFENNLDNIIPGLTSSFKTLLGFDFEFNDIESFNVYNYTVGADGRFYKTLANSEHVHYCINNTLLLVDENAVKKLEPPQYLVFEKYILDMKAKTIASYKEPDDSFIKSIGNINRVEVRNDGEYRQIIINDDIIIKLNQEGKMISYANPHVTDIEEFFLPTAEVLEELYLPNVGRIGSKFLVTNRKLRTIDIKNVKTIGARFLEVNEDLEEIDIKNVKKINSSFLTANQNLKKIELPNVKIIGDYFLTDNRIIEDVVIPNVEIIGDCFLTHANIDELSLQKATSIGESFLKLSSCKKISLPLVDTIPDQFMSYCYDLSEIYLPAAESIGNNSLVRNKVIETIYLPKVKSIGRNFMNKCKALKEINLPEVESIGYGFAEQGENITSVYIPKVKYIGDNFIPNAKKLTKIEIPSVTDIGNSFLDLASIKKLELPNVEYIGDDFMRFCSNLEEISLPKVVHVGKDFLKWPRKLRKVDMPMINEYCYQGLSDYIKDIIEEGKGKNI